MSTSFPRVMGVLNITPDSFSGDGVMQASASVGLALRQAEAFLEGGVAILDIGGESTRPHSSEVPQEEELRRVIPVIEAVREAFPQAVISVDSYKAEVVRRALDSGANMVNDISALQADAGMAEVVRASGCAVVLMHNRVRRFAAGGDEYLGGAYGASEYDNVVADVVRDLRVLGEQAQSAGIKRENIILDPGIGFGKNVRQNMQLIEGLPAIKALGYEVLLGPSRKNFIGRVLGREVSDRLAGTAACVAVGVVRGADIVRVHDAEFMVDIVRMTQALLDSEDDEVSHDYE